MVAIQKITHDLIISLVFSILVTFLPETGRSKLPNTIEDGEMMGKGDTLYSAIAKFIKDKRTAKNKTNEVELDNVVP